MSKQTLYADLRTRLQGRASLAFARNGGFRPLTHCDSFGDGLERLAIANTTTGQQIDIARRFFAEIQRIAFGIGVARHDKGFVAISNDYASADARASSAMACAAMMPIVNASDTPAKTNRG